MGGGMDLQQAATYGRAVHVPERVLRCCPGAQIKVETSTNSMAK
jgi:hypothetical protein